MTQAIAFPSSRLGVTFYIHVEERREQEERAYGRSVMTPDFSKAERNELASPGFSVISLHGDFSLVSHGAHLSCPRNRHSCLSQVRRAFHTATRDTTSTCGRVMRARRHHALPPRIALTRRYLYHPTRDPTNFPREIGSKIETSFVDYCSPGFLVFVFRTLSHRRASPRGLHRTGVVQLASGCTESTDLARKDPPEIRFSTTSTARKIRLP